ncbi:MAG: AAA family ATPase [Arenicellales bacterium]|nr:AAA family ATPase [Arenicellales bacterium]
MNQRLAPDLYLAVVSFTGSHELPVLGGQGDVIEYAVKMVQFDTTNELDLVLSKNGVTTELISELAEDLADFHQRVDRASIESEFGLPSVIRHRIKDNFIEILPCTDESTDRVLTQLETWVDDTLNAHEELLKRRKQNGFIRECHGDLHLGNMVLIEDKIRLFDCLEFNEQLRWIDVMSEIAFLAMDLDFHGRKDLAFQFLNKYLAVTGDYAGLELLPLYLVYRSMVRAKVACIRSRQSENQGSNITSVSGHLQLAQGYTRAPPPRLVIAHGVSGSGKTFLSEQIARHLPAIHIRSDVERMRCTRLSQENKDTRYSSKNIELIYGELLGIAEVVLHAGFPVIVDATFLLKTQRERFHQLATTFGIPFTILDFQCPEHVLRSRVQRRLEEGGDPSEATEHVLETQLQNLQALSPGENKHTIPIRTEQTVDVAMVVQHILS